jgi:hypothetical protein
MNAILDPEVQSVQRGLRAMERRPVLKLISPRLHKRLTDACRRLFPDLKDRPPSNLVIFKRRLPKLKTTFQPRFGREFDSRVQALLSRPRFGPNYLDDWTDREILEATMSGYFGNLAITATAVVPGATISGTSYPCQINSRLILATTLTAGQLVYADSTTTNPAGQLRATIANGTLAQAAAIGILLNGGAVGQAAQIATGSAGQASYITINAVMTATVEYYMSETAGDLCLYSDLSTADNVLRVGNALSTTVLQIQMQSLGVHP